MKKLNELDKSKTEKVKDKIKEFTKEELGNSKIFEQFSIQNTNPLIKIADDLDVARQIHKFTNEDYKRRINLIKTPLGKIQDGIYLKDAYTNPSAGYGYESGSPQESGQYVSARGLTRDFINLNQAYRGDAMFSKIIDMYAGEMLKQGIEIRCDLPTGEIQKIEYNLRKLTQDLFSAIKWSDLYGLSVALPIIKGKFNQEAFRKPFDIDDVQKGDFMGLKVLPKWQGVMPLTDKLVTTPIPNVINGNEIGKPLYYDVWITNTGKHFTVHRSWLLIFVTNELPGIENDIEQHGGVSVYERLDLALKNYNATINYIMSLLQMSTQRVLKLEGMTGLEQMSKEGQERFKQRMEQLGRAARIWNVLVLGEDDEFDYKAAQFNGLSSLALVSQENLSASAIIPLNKLFGKSPSGLNNSSEENLTDFYDFIKRRQEYILRENYDKLIPLIYRHCYGKEMPDYEFEFKSLWTINEQDKALILERKARSVEKAWATNAITLREYLLELKELGRVTDAYTNITDDYIKEIESSGVGKYRIVDFEIEKLKKMAQLKKENEPKEKSLKEATIKDAKEHIKIVKQVNKNGGIKNVLK